MAHLECKVCEAHTDTAALGVGWRRMWIDCYGQLFVSGDLRRGVTGLAGVTAVEEADACGQAHCLVLAERYIGAGSFERSSAHKPGLPPSIEVGIFAKPLLGDSKL